MYKHTNLLEIVQNDFLSLLWNIPQKENMCKIVPCVKLLITSVQRRDVRYPATPLKTLARRLIKPAESHCPGNDECEETTNVFFGVGQQLAQSRSAVQIPHLRAVN